MFTHTNKKQNGFTLIMSMMLLVILTMLGLNSIQGTRTEIAMSGNLRESDMSFQAAETGLISAEQFITNTVSQTTFNDSNGLLSKAAVEPDFFADLSWADAGSSSITIANVHTQPKFIIKHLGDNSALSASTGNLNITGYSGGESKSPIDYFRITSKGVGQTNGAGRVIQSYYAKVFD